MYFFIRARRNLRIFVTTGFIAIFWQRPFSHIEEIVHIEHIFGVSPGILVFDATTCQINSKT